jgi:regulator of RNase E activity RraA
MPTTDHPLLDQFVALDSEAISDALDDLGLPGGLGGITPTWGHPRVVGFASTVELTTLTGDRPSGSHIATTAVAAARPTAIMVVANAGRVDVSCWGGLLSLGASHRGIRGVVVDGACRDVGEARRLAFPVFARAATPRTARGRLRQVSAGETVVVGDVKVAPGDVVIADETGVAFVPRARAREVLTGAQRLVRRERAIAEEIRAGTPLSAAMCDARLADPGAASC